MAHAKQRPVPLAKPKARPLSPKRGVSNELTAELGMLISKSRKMIWSTAARRLEIAGESMLTFNLLGHLVRAGATTQRELANATAQHPAGISRLLEDLETQKLVRRRRDTKDRRKVYVEASTKGRASFNAMFPRVVLAVDQALAPLSMGERRTLRSLLHKLVGETSA